MSSKTEGPRGRTAWTSAAGAVALGLVVTLTAAAPQRGTPGEGKLAFEAATVKLAAPNAVRNQVATLPNRLSIASMTLTALIYNAYGGGGFNTSMRVTGGPDWANKTEFAIEGVTPNNATPQQMRLMLQTLLAERFALKVRDDTQSDAAAGDVLALVVDRSDGKLGPRVKPWTGPCPAVMPALMYPAPRRAVVNGPPLESVESSVAYCPTGYRPGGITADGVTMGTVAELLSLPPARVLLGTITQDRTGLTGRYAMELDYLFTGGPPPQDFAGPSLSTAIREQWGLRLVPSKGRLKLIVIESAEPPTAN
jgi:uncharacterized protein (TIGR03435 family)